MIEFRIKHKITAKDSTNASHAGQHWTVRKRKVDYWHMLTKEALQVVPRKVMKSPVMIEMIFDSSLDIDNHSSIAKYIIDGLVLDGWLLGDSKKHVQGLCLWFKKDAEFNGNSIIVKVVEL